MRLEEGGERIKTLKKVLKEVAAIYENARDEGILSIKFLNASQGKKDVTTPKLNAEPGPLSHIRWSGITKIGTQLENRILKNFVYGKKMTKPLLVMIITDGDVSRLLRFNLIAAWNFVHPPNAGTRGSRWTPRDCHYQDGCGFEG
jgi:hypothetical protein